MIVRTLDARTLGVDAVVALLERRASQIPAAVVTAVEEILAAVRARGDAALVDYTERFDRFPARGPHDLEISRLAFAEAAGTLDTPTRAALEYAAERIERYHAAAMPKSWRLTDEHGSSLGQEVRPLDRVGI